jgi:glycosyltransferase involved in cell wall biosynthesis
MQHVRSRVPDAELAVVGSGDQMQPLVRLSRELGLQDAVRFVGRVGDAELFDWYAAANVFALPSSSEAQGIVALEAMACGLPVVVSAVGGLIGTVEDGRSGYLVPSGEPVALADRLAALLSDEQKRVEMGVVARETVARDFSWPRAVAATVEVYREVVACQAQ